MLPTPARPGSPAPGLLSSGARAAAAALNTSFTVSIWYVPPAISLQHTLEDFQTRHHRSPPANKGSHRCFPATAVGETPTQFPLIHVGDKAALGQHHQHSCEHADTFKIYLGRKGDSRLRVSASSTEIRVPKCD